MVVVVPAAATAVLDNNSNVLLLSREHVPHLRGPQQTFQRDRRGGKSLGSLTGLGSILSLPGDGLWTSHFSTLNLSLLFCERGTPCPFQGQ